MTSKSSKAENYKTLVQRYGEDRVGSAILAKWRADPEAEEHWERLGRCIGNYWHGRRYKKVLKWEIILWHMSNGHRYKEVAEHMGISPQTVKTHLGYARKAMNLPDANSSLLVAEALRRGIIE